MKIIATVLYACHITAAVSAGRALVHHEGGLILLCGIGVVVFGTAERLVREAIWEAEQEADRG